MTGSSDETSMSLLLYIRCATNGLAHPADIPDNVVAQRAVWIVGLANIHLFEMDV